MPAGGNFVFLHYQGNPIENRCVILKKRIAKEIFAIKTAMIFGDKNWFHHEEIEKYVLRAH